MSIFNPGASSGKIISLASGSLSGASTTMINQSLALYKEILVSIDANASGIGDYGFRFNNDSTVASYNTYYWNTTVRATLAGAVALAWVTTAGGASQMSGLLRLRPARNSVDGKVRAFFAGGMASPGLQGDMTDYAAAADITRIDFTSATGTPTFTGSYTVWGVLA